MMVNDNRQTVVMESVLRSDAIIHDGIDDVLAMLIRLEADNWPRPVRWEVGKDALTGILQSITGAGYDSRGTLHVAGIPCKFNGELGPHVLRAIISTKVYAMPAPTGD